MKYRSRLAAMAGMIAFLVGGELLACGDKFLAAGRGTRYQRPKNARAASIVIYADPSTAALRNPKMQSFLERQGHRIATVESLEQLSAILSSRRFDIVLAASDAAAKIQKLFTAVPEAAAVVAVDARPKPAMLLSAIDKAVEQRDQDLRRTRTRS